MTEEDMQAVKDTIPEAAQVAAISDLQMSVVAQGVVRPVTLIGVTPGYRGIRRLLVLGGRYLDSVDMEMRSKMCVITPQLAKRLFGQDNPVGPDLTVVWRSLLSIGLLKKQCG